MLSCTGFVKTTILTKPCSRFCASAWRRKGPDLPEGESSHDCPYKDIWPSCSPDRNVCDFWLFNETEEQSYATSLSSVKSLKTSIRRAFWNLVDEEFKMSCSAFHQRTSTVLEAKADHVE